MNVKLISFTPNALGLLLRTKNTRLKYESDPATWPEEKQKEHLAYMRDTIKSSWEMVDYVFEITGVTRAFTHQLVRTRAGAYAQESQRTVDVRESPVLKPDSVSSKPGASQHWDESISEALDTYSFMVDTESVPVQDARGILPTNMTTAIVAKFSLRTLHEMGKVRLCVRTQGEYQDVFRAMRAAVIAEHPWVEEFRFIEVSCVGDGVCAFPRYGAKECKFWAPWMDRSAEQVALHKVFWAQQKQVAEPKAVDGKTM